MSFRKIVGVSTGLSILSLLASMHAAATAAGELQVLQRWKLGGAGGWDYLTVDSQSRRLFISRGTRVDVVDLDSGKVVGAISDTQGVHGIALATGLNRGFTSNGRANSVTVFELDSLKTVKEVAVPGKNPDAILFEPVNKRIVTFNGASKDATVLDASSLWRSENRTLRQVISGIAHISGQEFLISGKEWPQSYRVRIDAG